MSKIVFRYDQHPFSDITSFPGKNFSITVYYALEQPTFGFKMTFVGFNFEDVPSGLEQITKTRISIIENVPEEDIVLLD